MSTQVEKPKKTRSAAATLAIVFLILSFVALLISYIPQVFVGVRAEQEIVDCKQQLAAQGAASTVTSFIEEKFSELEAAVQVGDLVSVAEEEQKGTVEKLLGLEPAFRSLVLFDLQEQELVRVSRLSRVASERVMDRIGSDLFAQLERENRYVGPVYVDELTSEPMVLMAVPAIDIFGDSQGTLVAEVNLKFMWTLIDRLRVGETGLAYVVDRQGNLIASGDVSLVLRGENAGHLDIVGEFMHNPVPAGEAATVTFQGINDILVIGTYVPLGVPDWAVVVELPMAEAIQPGVKSTVLSVSVMLVVAALVGLVGVYIARRLAVPLLDLTETATRIARGETDLQAAVEGPTEVVSLAKAFNNMTVQLREMLRSEEEHSAELQQEIAERERLQQQVIEAQRQAIQELATPVIPVMEHVIILPLVGSVDSMRARDITRRLLVGIQEHEAEVVILDVTGVPVVDSGVAEYLNRTIQAARLKGARTIVTGISDAVAETIVDLGIDWSHIDTLSDLQAGLIIALKSLGFRLTR